MTGSFPAQSAPGVYVFEVPSAIKPIAGVSTSTAAFIGIVPDQVTLIDSYTDPNALTREHLNDLNSTTQHATYSIPTPAAVPPTAQNPTQNFAVLVTSWREFTKQFAGRTMSETPYPPSAAPASGPGAALGTGSGGGAGSGGSAGSGGGSAGSGGGSAGSGGGSAGSGGGSAGSGGGGTPSLSEDYLNFLHLAYAVYGFFSNGGSRCYVVRITSRDHLEDALAALDKIDEVSLVLAPGMIINSTDTNGAAYEALITHCTEMADRFAILDGPPSVTSLTDLTQISTQQTPNGRMPQKTSYAAWYFPWISIFDRVSDLLNLNNGLLQIPPSGHMAGIYARVDTNRGVFKAPANEAILGALDVTQPISKNDQAGLNWIGVNCLRVLNDNILVWGARTVGGDLNYDLKYINVRRSLLYLEKSIDQGTQWAVFEPNDPSLWQKITRNVSAFLTEFWRAGGLFGNTPQEAFYVKCDAETNPPDIRELGRVVTEVGVAIVRPAEFVIFYVSQTTANTLPV